MTTPDPIDINALRNTTTDITYDVKGETFRDFVLAQADADHDGVIHLGAEASLVADVLTTFEDSQPDGSLTEVEEFLHAAAIKNDKLRAYENLEDKIAALEKKNEAVNEDSEAAEQEIMKLLNLKAYDLSSVDQASLTKETRDKLMPLLERAAANTDGLIEMQNLLLQAGPALEQYKSAFDTYKKAHKFAFGDE